MGSRHCSGCGCHASLPHATSSKHLSPSRLPSVPSLLASPFLPPPGRRGRRSLTAQPEANLAVTAALTFLRLHQWWEGVQGRAPPFCAGAMGRLFGLVGE
jgi:hypothetical protein